MIPLKAEGFWACAGNPETSACLRHKKTQCKIQEKI
ncbi:hypothetical protein Barb6XT_01778 [Bacteroidales bacterium Barb6XT]|nr:hypothetical protein Barb6XT_01778 [Bacteroidales bacterium Barb6XT]